MTIHELESDEFGSLIEPHRRELQVHCYRMMGSLEDAEDMVQETFFRAWKRRETLQDQAALRAWLYKIATHACLDALKQQARRQIPRTRAEVASVADPIPGDVNEPIWLQPYPDELLPTDGETPDSKFSTQESIMLAFIAVLHLLPPRQRAVLLLRDVLDWKAHEVASLMETSESAVKSALFRARSTLAENQDVLIEGKHDIALDETLESQLAEYVRAWERADIDELMQLLKEDASFSMPPIPSWYRGHAEIRALISKTIFAGHANGRWKLYPTAANAQVAFGLYRRNDDQGLYQFYGIQVLTYQKQQIADILTFRYLSLYHYFKLPATLPINP